MNFIFDPSLVLYLPLHELDGSSFMSKDAYGHLCTVTGALWTPLGRSFDGLDDYVNCGKNARFDIGAAVTLEAWIKKSGTETRHIIGNFNAAGSKAQYNILYQEGYLRFQSAGTGGSFSLIGTTRLIPTDTWCHVLVTRISATGAVTLHVDGVADGMTGTSSIDKIGAFADCGNTAVGRAGDYTGAPFDGLIGGVRVYNRALSVLEVQQNYLANKRRYQ